MIINGLRVRRFKQFDDVTFELPGHVVLAGQNNSGKTTVLQSLSAWSLALEQWRSLNDPYKHNGYYSRKPLTRQAFNAVPLRSFDLLWRDRVYEGTVEIEVSLEGGASIAMELSADSTEQIYVRPSRDTPREVLERPTPAIVYISSMDGMEVEEPAINNPEWIRTLLGRQRPGSILRNLLLDVSRTDRWEDLRATVRRLFGFDLNVPETPGGQIICEFVRPGSERPIDIMGAGSGVHQVLLLLACIYTRPGAVLLIDEPDAHLHVFLQDTIFQEIRRVAAATNAQVIFATHSEVIFRSVPPEHLVVMMGPPRRLTNATEREQVDIINALTAPGVLYLEGYTDLNLLRAWAGVMGHPTADFMNRQPFWKPQVWEPRDDARGIRAQDHYNALRLVRADLTGVWLVDADGRNRGIQPSAVPERAALNRVTWSRYETESYLVHPVALCRLIERQTGVPATEIVDRFLVGLFGQDFARQFTANPFGAIPLVDNFLKNTKARTEIIGALLTEAGIHGFNYTRFDEIAAIMTPEEVHPEVEEKLDFIQRAFGL